MQVTFWALAVAALFLLAAAGGGITVMILLLNRKSRPDRCPKCDANVSHEANECPACGTILARAPIK